MTESVNLSNNMSLVDRIAERIKKSEVGTLITQDELDTIISQAFNKAFFESLTTGSGYNSKTEPPIIVTMAREFFEKAVKDRVEAVVSVMVESENFRNAVQSVALASIPNLLMNYGRRLAQEAVAYSSTSTINNIVENYRNNNLQNVLAAVGVPSSGAKMPLYSMQGNPITTDDLGADSGKF